jgi:hypothetical protein
MSPSTLRILIGLFLIAHGLVHAVLAAAPLPEAGKPRTPFFPSWWRTAVDPLWPIMRLGVPAETARSNGYAMWVVQLICFVLAGLGLLGVPGLDVLWRGFAVFSAIFSLMFLGFYWHPWLIIGMVIDLVIVAGYIMSWPAFLFS